ncbi:hypothetical protein K492DRAFT_240657 [Lichtheimia hyalospora FSU 10163]|nr:hypothetical protein K492DRAFT_240657 [Lichtheimia hyalospora FSU 10163]
MPLTKNPGSNLAGNKDLSCLRCRKKKAKCSKTRPACTRCARSNQLCEYPDAPPNLSDLSQKVLGLYDTLRKLEDTFVTQYGSSLRENNDQEQPGYNSSRASSEMPSIETLSIHQPAKRLKTETTSSASIIDEGALPGNWSMTLTSEGLTLHAVTRNIIEFTTFAKDFSQQLQYNNQTDTKLWEWFDDEPVDDDDEPDEKWQQLAALVLYFEAHSSAFHEWQDIGDARNWLLQAANRLSTSKVETSAVLGLEAQLMCLLKQVFALFYCQESGDNTADMRKVDVDDVLNLVRDIEIWEQHLPHWMQWSGAHDDLQERSLLLKMHIHMIHSIVKILLFRPFSIPTDHDNDELQTYTRTTFLDLSMASVDRLTACLSYFKSDDDWSRAGRRLGIDVIYRVQQTFPCDDELIHKLAETKKRLE